MKQVFFNIKSKRRDLRIKQKDMASRLGIELRTYQYLEAGREPDFDTLSKIATILGVTTAELLGEQVVRGDIEDRPDHEAMVYPLNLSDKRLTIASASENQTSGNLAETVKTQAETIRKLVDENIKLKANLNEKG